MVEFNQCGSSALYIASSNEAGAGWFFVITAKLRELPSSPISLTAAVENEQWKGSLVYVAADTTKIADNPAKFVEKIAEILSQVFNDGAIIFLKSGEIEKIPVDPETIIPLKRDSGGVTPRKAFNVRLTGDLAVGVDADISPSVTLSVPPNAENNYIVFTPTNNTPAVTLGGSLSPSVGIPPDLTASLWFAGPANGAFTFSLLINEPSLNSPLDMGFQVLIPNPNSRQKMNGADTVRILSALLPLAETSPQSQTTVGFSGQVNVLNPNNEVSGASPTVLYFTGKNGEGSEHPDTELLSYYRTKYGKKIRLIPVVDSFDRQQPAGLVINPGYAQTPLQNGFRFSPAGDFLLAVSEAKAGEPQKLLCGLSGTETIAFLPEIEGSQAGTRLRFAPNRPANVPQFPLKALSPVGPPIDPKASLLDAAYKTSWVTVVAPPSDAQRAAHYTAAPKGAELFGAGTSGVTGLLGPEDPGLRLPPDGSATFPLWPFAGFTGGDEVQDPTSNQVELLARQILSPTRKQAITNAPHSPSAYVSLFAAAASAAAANDSLTNTTTPTGFITRYASSSGTWKQLLLSQVQDPSGAITRQLGFTGLQAELQAAFQTSDQFLVVANNQYLGAPASGVFMPPSSDDIRDKNCFYNTINIGQWNFAVQTGQRNQYGDYRSVMLIKGVKGKIFDLDQATGAVLADSLVLSPDKWTMKNQFAAPNPPDLSELVTLSNWLVDYCKDAYARKDNPYFANFLSIIQDENWTGVLILKAAISEIPSDLAGIMAGVKDSSDFYVHHIGIEIGQIDQTKVEQKGSTSMFGLVYYVDPNYDDSTEPHAIAPRDSSAPYDFTLLTLKALFENSTIKKFDSLAQIVLNQIFGSTVSTMVDVKPTGSETNPHNAVLLEGGVQNNSGAVIYNLSSKWPNRYFLANNILTSVEIDTAQMSTRDDGSKSGQIVSWIGMSGFMNFAVILAPDEGLPAFDIFSFGPNDAQDTALRRGLNFNNLGLKITIPHKAIGVSDRPSPVLEMQENEIAFNSSASDARDKSLFRNFQLEVAGLVSGDAKAAKKDQSDPVSLGYLPVVTQYQLRGVSSGARGWHGLNFKVNLGTPGALAGKVSLDSYLLIAWANDSGSGGSTGGTNPAFQAQVGIQLPGAGSGGELFSLQTVIKLSIGLIQLMYSPPVEGNPKKKGGFLLVLNQIALKLLGLLKLPPSGNTAFLLFGDPEAIGSTGLGWFAIYNQEKKSD
jgi:hypothetical protein